jgi:hypothetical protein
VIRDSLRSLVISGITLAVAAVAATPAAARTPRPHPHRKPWPITITIQTLPRLTGIRLALDGTTRITDGSGRAAFTAEHNFQRHTLVLLDSAVNTPSRRYRFTRWAGQRDPNQAFRTTVTGLPMRADYTVTAAFTVQYPVTARFVDQSGRNLDVGQVKSATIRKDDGNIIDLPPSRSLWLDGQVPMFQNSTLQLHQVAYSLQTVTVNGTNVVDAGKQRFQPSTLDNPTFVTQFHDLTIRSHDAFFGGGAGSAVEVTYPDGVVRTVEFGEASTATLDNLPRGEYSVKVVTRGGIALARHLRLSQANTVDIIVLSRTDLAVAGLALLLLAFGLLFAGRTQLRHAVLKRVRASLMRLKPIRREPEVPPA